MPCVRTDRGLECIETLVEGEARFRILSDLPYVFLDPAQHPLVDLCLPEKALAEQKRPEVIPIGKSLLTLIRACGRMFTETEKSRDIDGPAAVIMKEWHTSGRQQGLYILNRLHQCPDAEDEKGEDGNQRRVSRSDEKGCDEEPGFVPLFRTRVEIDQIHTFPECDELRDIFREILVVAAFATEQILELERLRTTRWQLLLRCFARMVVVKELQCILSEDGDLHRMGRGIRRECR